MLSPDFDLEDRLEMTFKKAVLECLRCYVTKRDVKLKPTRILFEILGDDVAADNRKQEKWILDCQNKSSQKGLVY